MRVAASVAFAFALAAATPAHARQTDSSSPSTSPSKRTSHRKSSKKRNSKHAQAAPTPDRISEIQSSLARGGYYQGDPSGKWDSDTVAAMEKFQSVNGLNATGKLDAPTLQKLGLGSDIAGVSAPKPVVPKCCSAPSGSTPPPPSDKTSPPAQPLTPPAAATSASNSAVSDPKSPQH